MSTTIEKLYLFQLATLPVTPSLPVVSYLVQTTDGRNILIDTGLPENPTPPPGMPNPVLHKNIVEQLADLGLQPDDIDTLICTHLDMDHTGHSGAFTKAVRYIQRAHYEQAIEDPRFHHLRAEWDVPTEKYVLLDGDYELVPGFRLIETSGHRRGHQSVLLHLPQTGAVLLIIDAVPHRALFTPDRPLTPADDQDALEAVQASARKLLAIAEQEQPLVIFGHDGSQWSELEKTPECYR